uniref:Uncharacterized protein n=1 Tax=viral metagenome TaxID=1070528 RepID=A0A6M3K0M4_9ZZZZ
MKYVFNPMTGQIETVVDVDDTPVNGAATDAISSNWAYDHSADVDAHSAQISLDTLFNVAAILGTL